MSTWTTEKPTVPGWYWWRGTDGFEQIVYVGPSHKFYQVQVLTGRAMDMSDGEWAGPLEVPE